MIGVYPEEAVLVKKSAMRDGVTHARHCADDVRAGP
jgi:hypothetical protein